MGTGDPVGSTLSAGSSGLSGRNQRVAQEILAQLQIAFVTGFDENAVQLNGVLQIDPLVGVIDLERFEIYPETVNLSSRGRTIRASIQLPPLYDPRDVVAGSVALYGELYAEPGSLEIADENGDGIDEAILRFDRQVFAELVPEGDLVPVTITGEVDGQTWFQGTTQVRIRRRSANR